MFNASPDKPGFMEGLLIVSKLVADGKTGRILGAQCVGPGNVSKQIAQWAMAIQGNLTVEDVVNADLPYAPPFSLAIDHFIATAHIMQNREIVCFCKISLRGYEAALAITAAGWTNVKVLEGGIMAWTYAREK